MRNWGRATVTALGSRPGLVQALALHVRVLLVNGSFWQLFRRFVRTLSEAQWR